LTVTSKVMTDAHRPNDVINLKNDTFIELAVRDTGIGMDRATQNRIFEPFFTTKEMGRGTGLGLASVYGVVKNHGGTIQVKSAPGKGSTFTLTLPAAKSPRPNCTIVKERAELPAGGGTILLVDDEPLILKYCHEMIKSLGFSVLSTQDPIEAIRIYQDHSQHIDLAILDMIMPKMKRLQLLEALQAINPDIRVIITTGYAMDSRISKLISCGRHQCLKKPFTSDQLANTIAHLMSHKSESAAKANAGSI
jgi:two-component system cell cycle sensor histidine kinase/response regulator CckA